MQQQGLTLLELLVALVILVILISIATPAMDQFIHQQRANSYLQQFNRHLHYARVQASSSQQPVRVCPVVANHCLGNWQQDPLQLLLINPLDDSSELLRELPRLPNQHRFSYSRQQLQFRRDGSLDALENGTFYYCPPSRFNWHYRIVLNQAGRARLQHYTQTCPV